MFEETISQFFLLLWLNFSTSSLYSTANISNWYNNQPGSQLAQNRVQAHSHIAFSFKGQNLFSKRAYEGRQKRKIAAPTLQGFVQSLQALLGENIRTFQKRLCKCRSFKGKHWYITVRSASIFTSHLIALSAAVGWLLAGSPPPPDWGCA